MTCLGRRNTHRHSGHRHQGSWTSAINTITIIIIIRPNHINLTKRQDDIVVADMDVGMVADKVADRVADMVYLYVCHFPFVLHLDMALVADLIILIVSINNKRQIQTVGGQGLKDEGGVDLDLGDFPGPALDKFLIGFVMN